MSAPDWFAEMGPHEPMVVNAGYCGGCAACGLLEEEVLCDTCGGDAMDCPIAGEKLMEMT